MTEKFLLRAEQIDRQFANIFQAIKNLQEFYEDEQVGRGISRIIRLFENYAHEYQSLEELVMMQYDYPDRSNHDEKEYDDCNLTLPKLEMLLRSGAVYKHGVKNVELQSIKENQYSELAESILYQLSARRKGTPDNVLLAGGGGAALFEKIEAGFPNSDVRMDPEKSAWLNVLGMEAMIKAGQHEPRKYSSFASPIKAND